MNIQSEKLELIKLITNIDNKKVISKLSKIIASAIILDSNKPTTINPAMEQRLSESKKQISEGKGIKITLDEIWK